MANLTLSSSSASSNNSLPSKTDFLDTYTLLRPHVVSSLSEEDRECIICRETFSSDWCRRTYVYYDDSSKDDNNDEEYLRGYESYDGLKIGARLHVAARDEMSRGHRVLGDGEWVEHCMHLGCMLEYLQWSNECPFCREVLFVVREEGDEGMVEDGGDVEMGDDGESSRDEDEE